MRALQCLLMLAFACCRVTAPAPHPALFAFHSNAWVNLHHFLYVIARARQGLDPGRVAVTSVLADTAGFDQLSPALKDNWNAALAYYTRSVASKDILFDPSLVAVTNRLAECETATTLAGAQGLDSGLASALDRAMPAYRALWWPRHDARNRQLIGDVAPLLASHGGDAVAAESRAFGMTWPVGIRVDVSAYTNWAGAYTTERPGHINISSTVETNYGPSGFESLFHEVLHTMEDSVFAVIQSTYRSTGRRMPRDPTHPFIFYTAGEITRRFFPGYVPFAEQAGMWSRISDYSRVLPLLREHWQPFLDGRAARDEAVRAVAVNW